MFVKKGFTLVELSIVLVIIGLLIVGILVGQSLVESVRISQVVRTISQTESAIRSFYSRYRSIPGDSTKVPGGDPAFSSDGDGILEDDGTYDLRMEVANFWYHLNITRSISFNDISCYDLGLKTLPTFLPYCGPAFGFNKNAGMIANPFFDSALRRKVAPNYFFIGDFSICATGDVQTTDCIGGAMSRNFALALDNKIDNQNLDNGDVVAQEGTDDGSLFLGGFLGNYQAGFYFLRSKWRDVN